MSQAVVIPNVRSKPPPEAGDWRDAMTSRLAELPAGLTKLSPDTVLIQPDSIAGNLERRSAAPSALEFRFADAWWLERRLREAGWHFFFVVPAITTTALAFDRSRALHKARQHLIRKSRPGM